MYSTSRRLGLNPENDDKVSYERKQTKRLFRTLVTSEKASEVLWVHSVRNRVEGRVETGVAGVFVLNSAPLMISGRTKRLVSSNKERNIFVTLSWSRPTTNKVVLRPHRTRPGSTEG